MMVLDPARSKELAQAIAIEIWKPVWYAVTASVVMGFLFTSTDDTDRSWWHRSGLEIKTDCATGLQYLASGGGVTPRLNTDGTQMKAVCK